MNAEIFIGCYFVFQLRKSVLQLQLDLLAENCKKSRGSPEPEPEENQTP